MVLLLPYDCVRLYLEAHPLVKLANVSPTDIHSCLIEMLESKEQASSKPHTQVSKKDAVVCKYCKHKDARLEVDARESNLVCTECGVVQRWNNPDNCKTFESDSLQTCSRKMKMNDMTIAKWVHASVQHQGDEWKTVEIANTIRHFSEYRVHDRHTPSFTEYDISRANFNARIQCALRLIRDAYLRYSYRQLMHSLIWKMFKNVCANRRPCRSCAILNQFQGGWG